eukprot:superscaffoldBa00002976_g15799
MEKCNYSTFFQAILGSFHSNSVKLSNVWTVVTDNAAYCLKAYREVLKGVMPNSLVDEEAQALTVKLTFISESCSKLMTALTILEGTHPTTAVSSHNVVGDLEAYLVNGTAKTCGYGVKTDEIL